MNKEHSMKLPRIAAFLAFLLLLPTLFVANAVANADEPPKPVGEVDTFDLSLTQTDATTQASYSYIGLQVYSSDLSKEQGRSVDWVPKARFLLAEIPAADAKTTPYIEERIFDLDLAKASHKDVIDKKGNVVAAMDEFSERFDLSVPPAGYAWYRDISIDTVLPKNRQDSYLAQVYLSSHDKRLTYPQGSGHILSPRVVNRAEVTWIGFSPELTETCVAADIHCAMVNFSEVFNPASTEGYKRSDSALVGSIPADSTWANHYLYTDKVTPILDPEDSVEIGRTSSGYFRYEITDAQRERMKKRAGGYLEHWFMSYNEAMGQVTDGVFADSVYSNEGRIGGALASAALKIKPPKGFWDLSDSGEMPADATPVFVDNEVVDTYNGGSKVRFTRAIKVTYKLAEGSPEGAKLLDKDNQPLTENPSGYVRFNTAPADTLPVPGTAAPENYRFVRWQVAGAGNAGVLATDKLRIPDNEVVFEAVFEEIPEDPGTDPEQPGTDPGTKPGTVPDQGKKPLQPPTKLPKTGN